LVQKGTARRHEKGRIFCEKSTKGMYCKYAEREKTQKWGGGKEGQSGGEGGGVGRKKKKG